MSNLKEQLPGLYIHIPFCRSKCPYCAFFSVPSTSLVPRWLEAFGKEVDCYKDSFNAFDSLYLGGGTPTVLDAHSLGWVMDQVYRHFTFDPYAEVTIEANPCDLTPDKIHALKNLGFNRVSLGVQSFDPRTLSFLGRNHTVQQAEKAVVDLRTGGFDNISIDLIYGFEGQNMAEWMDTLSRALSLSPEHLSCYQFTVENKTVFGGLRDKGKLFPISEGEEREFFLGTARCLEEHGYIHYEVSSYAKSIRHYSRHNYKYWLHTPYLGLGPSAHSFSGSRRWWNVRSVREYCEILEKGEMPVEGSEKLSEDQFRLESIMLGLRMKDGFDQDILTQKHETGRVFRELQDAGFVDTHNGRVIPTRKGFLVADYLASCLGG